MKNATHMTHLTGNPTATDLDDAAVYEVWSDNGKTLMGIAVKHVSGWYVKRNINELRWATSKEASTFDRIVSVVAA